MILGRPAEEAGGGGETAKILSLPNQRNFVREVSSKSAGSCNTREDLATREAIAQAGGRQGRILGGGLPEGHPKSERAKG